MPTVVVMRGESWDRRRLTTFRLEWIDALTKGATQFNFEGHEYLVEYAKYMIDYLDEMLPP
jgi:hypothetical protein